MKSFLYSPTLLFLSLAALTLPVKAASGHNHEHKQHDAHLHGSAELMVAIGGNSVEINLESPAANIVGFEHRATSPEQIKAAEKAQSTLQAAEALFAFSGSSCTLVTSSIEMGEILKPDHDHNNVENDDHNYGVRGTHSEISAIYRFQCVNGTKVTGLSVNLHKHFPAIEKLNVMWLTDDDQGATELTQESNFIRVQ